MSFWARASSLLCLLWVGSAAHGQATGRFGREGLPQPSGLELTAEGFRIERAPGDTFRFLSPLAEAKRVETSERHCIVHFREIEGNPKQIIVNTRSPGFEIDFNGPPTFRLASLRRPLLTVDGATYADQPTPETPWVLVSFYDHQPPVLLVSLDAPRAWNFIGQSGNWILSGTAAEQNRIRVALPRGRDSGQNDNVESLGNLALTLAIEQDQWCRPTPKLLETRVEDVGEHLQVVQKFDQAGALLPGAFPLARQGGYAVEVQTGASPVQADLTFGPQVFSMEPKVVTRFPFIGLAPGRAVVQGEIAADAPQFDHLMALLVAAGDPVAGKKNALEGAGGIRSFAECAMSRWGWVEPEETEWKRLLWVRDPETLQLTGVPPTDAAWLSAALAVRGEERLQVEACQVWAGVAALRSLPEFQRKRGLTDPVVQAEVPDREVWNALFGQWPIIPGAWWRALAGPVRVLSSQRILCAGNVLNWKPVAGEGPLLLSAPSNVVWTGDKGAQIEEATWLEGRWLIRAKPGPDGRCWIKGEGLPAIPELPKSGQH